MEGRRSSSSNRAKELTVKLAQSETERKPETDFV